MKRDYRRTTSPALPAHRVFKEAGHLHAVVDALAHETVRRVPEVALA